MSGMSQREYWASLSRSFDRRFIDEARREFDQRNRTQAHRSRENGTENTSNATTVREDTNIRPEKEES